MVRALLDVFKGAFLQRNFTLWFLIVIIPIGGSLLMMQLLSAETPKNMAMGVVVEENSRLASRIIRGIETSPSLHVAAYCEDLSDCASRMRTGDINGILVIPSGLEKKAYRSEAPVVSVYTNAQSLLTSNLITKTLRGVVGTQGAILEPRNLPDPIRTEIHVIGNPVGNYENFLTIGLVAAIFGLVSMICSVYVFSYPIREKRVNIWREAARGSSVIAVVGRWLPLTLILWVEMLVMMSLARRSLPPMELMDSVVYALAELAMLAACTAMSAVFVAVTGSMRIATSTAAVIGGPAFAFTGQTFPLLAMPFFVRCFAFLLPLSHFLQVQSALLIGHIGLSRALESLEILLGMDIFWLLLAIVIMSWQLKRCGDRELCSET